MQKWSYAVLAAVLAAGVLGVAADADEPTARAWNVELRAQGAHCWVAARSRPMSLNVTCA